MTKLKESLASKLTKKQLCLLPASFDIVGSIAIFNEIPIGLKSKEKIIGDTILKNHLNIKTVAKKTGNYTGKYRLPKIKIIAGKRTKETIHKESNIQAKLHVEKCYFSARSSNERLRISSLVKEDESILVMFSGIAIFPLVISKNSKTKEIYAIEINPIAHKYAQENLELNKIKNIKLFLGDVKDIIPKIKKKFDRIIMPLPKSAEDYLDLLKKVSKKNTTIHFYDFSQKKDFPDESINKIKSKIKNIKILNSVKCGHYSPFTYRVCIDFNL
jgi:tRNA (guanine37-N1)-methyltransferase